MIKLNGPLILVEIMKIQNDMWFVALAPHDEEDASEEESEDLSSSYVEAKVMFDNSSFEGCEDLLQAFFMPFEVMIDKDVSAIELEGLFIAI